MQWAIYDAYIAYQEKQLAQEDPKQKAAAKKATANVETASTQDPVKATMLAYAHCTAFNHSFHASKCPVANASLGLVAELKV